MEKRKEHALVRSKAPTLAWHARQDMGGSDCFSNFSNACTCYNSHISKIRLRHHKSFHDEGVPNSTRNQLGIQAFPLCHMFRVPCVSP